MRFCLLASIAVPAVALMLSGCHDSSAQTLSATKGQLQFNQDIRPILSDNCFRCHGPDSATRKAGLRLDMPEPAYGEIPDSKGKHAVVPGRPEDSEILKRILSKDPEERMPKNKDPLTQEQVAKLTQWIKEGAVYQPLWSLIPPQKPQVAANGKFEHQAVNDVDRLVFARLESRGLAPSPEADRETLINRVSFTLTGLPPSLEEVDAFVNDKSPNAYEKVVDRLLASPAEAEHMAGEWMNAARWAESDGFLDDHQDRFLWPWRDWVIDAFNKNMPFNEFATWQLAGDLLPGSTREQLLATAFLRLGERTTENGALNEEYRIESTVDKANTIGTAFLGLTVGCARCHDHKYDPISQADYYSLTGFFNSLDEPGVYTPGFAGLQGGPTLDWPTPEKSVSLEKARTVLRDRNAAYDETLLKAVSTAQSTVAKLLNAGTPPSAAKATKTSLTNASDRLPGISQLIRQAIDDSVVAYYPFDSTTEIQESDLPTLKRAKGPPVPAELGLMKQVDPFKTTFASLAKKPGNKGNGPSKAGSAAKDPANAKLLDQMRKRKLLPFQYSLERLKFSPAGNSGVGPAVLQDAKLGPGAKGQALYFTDENKGFFAKDVGYYDRTQQFSIDASFYPLEVYKTSVPILDHSNIKNSDDPNSGNAGYELQFDKGRLVFYMSHSRPFNMIALAARDALPLKQWSRITVTYDGSSKASGVHLYVDGREAATEVIRDHLTQSILPDHYKVPLDDFNGLAFGSRFREKSPIGSALDEVRVFNRALTPIEVAYLQYGNQALKADPTGGQVAALLAIREPEVRTARHELDAARFEENELASAVPQVLVMGDTIYQRPTYRLNRGLYDQPQEEVPVQGLQQVFAWNPKFPRNRVGLSDWLFDRKNPLTARVFVNRLWQMHFGTGLVRTAEDFGSQGSNPTNPELLDWLAVQFMDSGWDIKKIHKLIVMSATYRQSSKSSEELFKQDSANDWLARGPRFRMSAAMIRDNALAASGLLVNKVGGPSVFPYQPEGIWNPQNSFYVYPEPDKQKADDQHRRTLYTFIKRNALNPSLQLLDAADPNVSIVRLRTSNTPLQALLLLNGPQYVEAYRAMAAQAALASEDTTLQLVEVYRESRRKRPTDEQLAILKDYYETQAALYRADAKAAADRVSVGVAPLGSSKNVVRLAALTDVASLVMSAPDTYFIE